MEDPAEREEAANPIRRGGAQKGSNGRICIKLLTIAGSGREVVVFEGPT